MRWVHWFLAFSNLLGLPVLIKTCVEESYFHFGLSLWVVLSSFLMHLTETKHDLLPEKPDDGCLEKWARKCSVIFLWQDRIMSYIVGAYVAYLWYEASVVIKKAVIIQGSLGLILMILGENNPEIILFNDVIYPIFHALWHLSIYLILYILM